MSISWYEQDASFRAAFDELNVLLLAEEPVETVLERVVTLAPDAIEGCDLASITTHRDGEFQTVAQTDAAANLIDQAQYEADAGPCVHAFRHGEVVSVPSITEGDSWTAFRDAALAHNVHSSFSLPLSAGEVRFGAFNLYGRRDHAFNGVPPDAALLFAKQAAASVLAAQTHAQTRDVIKHLETALESRDLIGMAKGIVMINERVPPEEAFGILKTMSQHRNVKLRDIAAEVVRTGVTPR